MKQWGGITPKHHVGTNSNVKKKLLFPKKIEVN